MTRTKINCNFLFVYCVFLGVLRLSLATERSIDSLTTFPVAKGTECVLPLIPFRLSFNTSDETIVFQLCGDCPICTNYGIKAGQLKLPEEVNLPSFVQTSCRSFTLKQLQDGLVIFQHFYSAGLEKVVFNLTVTKYKQNQTIDHEYIQLYAQPFVGNFTLLTDPQFLLKEQENVVINSKYLSFATNFKTQQSNLFYRVLNYTQYGVLEVFEGSQWIPIDERLQQSLCTFSQSEINTKKIRYRQTVLLDVNAIDLLKLQVYNFQLNGSDFVFTFFILSQNFSSITPQITNPNMTTTNISLDEGKQISIDSKLIPLSFSPNIQFNSVNFSLSSKQFNVTVTIIQESQYGILHSNDSTPLTSHSVFNYNEILSNHIMYFHDGSDTLTDTVILKLTVTSATTQALFIPEPLSLYHVLQFKVIPVNDNLPQLIQHHSISPLEGSYITLNSSFFEIFDFDHQNVDFLILVDNDTIGSGYFAKENLDKKLKRFYMSEVRAKKILYTFPHLRSTEILNYHHNITMSDGIHSVKEKLHVSVLPMPISVTLKSNSSCILNLNVYEHGPSIDLLKSLFDTQLAIMERLSEVIVNVIKQPALATLVYYNSNISSFPYSDFSEVQYRLTNALTQDTQDSFSVQFIIGHGMSEIINIPICIEPLPYPELLNHTSFNVPSKSNKPITSLILHATQSGVYSPQSIIFTIEQKPQYGNIINSTTTLEVSSFTQEDIDLGLIYYHNNQDYKYSEYSDYFDFTVRNNNYTLQEIYRMDIQIKHNVLNVTNKGLSVIEEGSHRILKTEFSVEPLEDFTMYIYINQFPMYGNLTLARPFPSPPVLHPPTLNLVDLEKGYLSYNHSGMEEPSDHFTFLVVAIGNGTHHIFSNQFMIRVNMTNDNPPTRQKSAVTDISVPEGGTKAITTDLIKFLDADYGYNINNLKYTITFFTPHGGQLCLRDHCFTAVDVIEWYQGDMHGDLYYKALDSPIGSYACIYKVSDGLFTVEHVVVVISVVDIQALRNSSEPIVVDENSFVTLRSNNIDYATDSSGMILASEMQYTITEGPLYGRLQCFDRIISESEGYFTQADINAGNVTYHQDGSNQLNDSFTFSLRIRNTFKTTGIAKIIINPVDDDTPVLEIDKILFVVNGSVAHINNSILFISDNDTQDPNNLRYSVRGVSAGKLEKRSSHDPVYQRTTSFTQYDINKKFVRYKHDLLPSWSDLIYLNISDSINHQDNIYTLEVIVISSMVVPATTGILQLNEGANVSITPSNLVIGHPYFSMVGKGVAKGVGKLVQPLSYGKLLVNGKECNNECSFGLDDIKRERLLYVHDGSETTSDQIVFTIHWDNFSTNQLTLPIIIEPVNDEPPHIINNTLLVIYASSSLTVTSHYLYTGDIDTPPQYIKYTFNMTPSQRRQGHFTVNGTQSNTFTQADINNGHVMFVDKHFYDGFVSHLNFTVTDGVAIVSSMFRYRPEVVNIVMLANNSLTVSMNGSAHINSSILSASTNKNINSSSIQYIINTQNLKYGHIVVNQTKVTQSKLVIFQSDIYSGLVLYKHTAGEYWESLDVMNIVVFHPLATKNITISLTINIQLLVTEGSQFAVKKRISLEENSMVCLNCSFIDARNIRYYTWRQLHDTSIGLHDLSLLFRITSPPIYGILGIDMNETYNFTEGQLEAGLVCYSNNGHESNIDSFQLQVIVKTPNGLLVNTTTPESIPINIELYNDEKPYLAPSLSLSKSFVRDINEFITDRDILVTDRDNNPENIVFTVTRSPTLGALVLSDSDIPVNSFTQSHINNRKLVYVPSQLGVTWFVFYFNDGTFNSTESYNFTIEVNELSLNVSYRNLQMYQFDSFVTISTSLLNSATNGNSSHTYFTIIEEPLYGQVLIANKISNQFTQHDIEKNLVQYKLINQRQYRDKICLNVSNSYTYTTLNLSVVVVARGSFDNSVILSLNPSLPLPSNLLDLSEINIPQPLRINLTSPLKYGYLSFKFIELGTNPETSFRYSMLENGNIYYTWSPVQPLTISSNGEYIEELRGVVVLNNGMSPGEFKINLTLIPVLDPSPTNSTTSISMSSTLQPSNGPKTEPNADSNTLTISFYIPLVGLLLVVLLLLVIVIVFCCYQSKSIKKKLTKGFVPPSSSLSQKLPSNLYYSAQPPLGGGPIHDNDSDTGSSISGADIMMVQNIPHQTHPMMTISASHSHIQYPHESTYHSMSGIHSENVSYSQSPQLRHLQSPHSVNTFSPSRDFTREIDVRSNSPTRRPSPTRSRNVRPYASLTKLGRSSPVKSLKDYPARPESSSSLGYDSSCLTEERHSRPTSSVVTPIKAEGNVINQQQEEIAYTRPALKTPQYWV